MKKTAIYIRVSTGHQENSELMQSEKCLTYCNMKGYEVVDVFIDSNVSGGVRLFDRPAGSRLKKCLDNKEIDNIVVYKLDRMTRSVVDGLTVLNDFNANNIDFSVIDMSGETLDSSTPLGRMMVTMMLAFAELERHTIRDRVKKSLQHRKENLKVYSGKTPYGFTRKDKDLVPNLKEMEVVKQIYRMKDNDSELQTSFRTIARVVKMNVSKVHRIYNDEIYEQFL